MYTKENLVNSVQNEVRIIKYLFSRLPDGQMDWRPTPGQRSTIELLQYLSHIGYSIVYGIKNGSSDSFGNESQASKEVRSDSFENAMDDQLRDMVQIISDLTDDELNVEVTLFGTTGARGVLLVEMLLKHVTAYRHQLFLYAKMSGNSEIGTMDNWAGVPSQK